jgi:hypothetical protein
MGTISPLTVTGDVTERIAALAANGIPLKLTSSFKGVVLSQEITILEVLPGYLVLQTPNHRICAALNNRVYLQSQYLPQTLSAQLVDLNVWTNKLTVTNLMEIGKGWVDRRNERVQPRDPIHAHIRSPKAALRGSIQNISVNGIGTLLCRPIEQDELITPESLVHLDFELPDVIGPLAVRGSIVNMAQLPNRMVKLGVELFPNVRQVHVLEGYIEQRRAEIFGELDRVCMAALEPRPTKDLFF